MPGIALGLHSQPPQQRIIYSEAISRQKRKAKKKRLRGLVNCPVCGIRFDKPSKLREHSRLHDDQYKCGTCGQTFAELCNLILHQKKHAATPHTCETCGNVFTKAASLRLHEKSHQGNRPRVKCPRKGCGRDYVDQAGLNRHLNNVSGMQTLGRTKDV